ncbi:hypothetical protein GCM10025760_20420 [Microbacterium yannicii]|uniref:Aldehyde dehydrogenase family protein n=1 Tax=Microbacterium yannicii TaxID=671622 RepID=A0ABP9MBR7_9MICO
MAHMQRTLVAAPRERATTGSRRSLIVSGASLWPLAGICIVRRTWPDQVTRSGWINQHGALNRFVPFGGTKASGYGQEFGVAGLKAVAAAKVVSR